MISLVRVNRGRWIVDCPNPECGWAYDAIGPLGDTRYFHRCVGDDRGPGCGTQVELVWPSADEAEEIVWALSMRNSVATRNWEPYETVDQLLAENDAYLVSRDLEYLIEHGIGVVT